MPHLTPPHDLVQPSQVPQTHQKQIKNQHHTPALLYQSLHQQSNAGNTIPHRPRYDNHTTTAQNEKIIMKLYFNITFEFLGLAHAVATM